MITKFEANDWLWYFKKDVTFVNEQVEEVIIRKTAGKQIIEYRLSSGLIINQNETFKDSGDVIEIAKRNFQEIIEREYGEIEENSSERKHNFDKVILYLLSVNLS
jgi:hypothetical protein